MRLILLILISVFFIKPSKAQTIEKFSMDSGGASTLVGGIEILYTLGEVAVQELNTGAVAVSEGFINADFKIFANLKMFLQGPLTQADTPGLMNDNLRASGYLPIISPYRDNATCDASIFTITGADAIVDWVWIELRGSNDNTILVNGRSALLQRDGDVVETDGISNIVLQASPKDYYVIVNHRNHLGAMSLSTIGLSESTTTLIDFRDNLFLTFGTNAQTLLASGHTGLWSGDTNNTRSITFSGANNDVNGIKDDVLLDPVNVLNLITFSSNGYLLTDLDLNGVARFSGSPNDSNIIKDNILNHPANFLSLPTFTISSTIPNDN
ncbi:hemagglutinin protein [uncultured Psychroserpens sp.]|uniref:hemagglutinin protein n=1 Tax=uncultured Psychroserpens sp. TaxID=255436 RepID=UPI0026217C43|nr:hemagglutinin protein [uncultured Psychroserpens sp.]